MTVTALITINAILASALVGALTILLVHAVHADRLTRIAHTRRLSVAPRGRERLAA